MDARPVTHPSADTLQAFGLGKMDDFSAEVLMDHLEICAACRTEVAALSGDDFLARVRQAHGRNSSLPPNKSLSDVGPTLKSVSTKPPCPCRSRVNASTRRRWACSTRSREGWSTATSSPKT